MGPLGPFLRQLRIRVHIDPHLSLAQRGPLMFRPWLWLPATWAHKLSPLALRLYGRSHPYQTLTWAPFTWRGLEFHNRLGLAGGVDKNGETVPAWWTLGPGFVEVGTVTPEPQTANPGKVIDRDRASRALWNRMGFPNDGADALVKRLKRLYQPHFTPLLINLGKNRTTPLPRAAEDYTTLMCKLKEVADIFVINISSPNTAQLRELHSRERLGEFLQTLGETQKALRAEGQSRPLLLKLSPDLSDEDLDNVLAACTQSEVIDGWVLTNTTLSRPAGSPFPSEGGVSGAPLAALSEALLKKTLVRLGNTRRGKLIVSCGGVMSAADVRKRIELGADLVQVYSALIYEGPFFFRKIAKDIQWQEAGKLP